MSDQEALTHYQERLTIYRRSLAHLLQQAAQYGGEVYAPIHVANGIHEAREEIRRIKAILRAHDVTVDDLPDDDPPLRVPASQSRRHRATRIGLGVFLLLAVLGIAITYVALRATTSPPAILAPSSVSQALMTATPVLQPPVPLLATPAPQPSAPLLVTAEIPQSAAVVLLMSLSEGAGDMAADTSGHGNHGRLQGGFGKSWNEGKDGTGLYFDGASLIRVEDSESLRFTTQLTVEAWIRAESVDNKTRNIVTKISQTDGFAFRLFLRNGYPTFDVHSDSGDGRVEGADQLLEKRWYRVMGAYDGRYLRIFVDGTEVDSTPYTNSIRPTRAWLAIGSSTYQNEFFLGDIDEIKISGR